MSQTIDLVKLQQAGFTAEIKPRRAAVVFSVEGLDKSGKTHFGFTAPGPVFYQSTDFGDEGVIQKHGGNGKVILRPTAGDYKLDIPTILDRSDPAAMQPFYAAAVNRFVADYRKAIELGVRSIVWDKGSEFWEWVRLMHYGGRQSAGESNYQLTARANGYYRDLLREANVAGINLIVLNELKPVFDSYREDGKLKHFRTDKLESGGNDKDPQLATARLRALFCPPEYSAAGEQTTPGHFRIEIRSCRDNPQVVGMVVTNPDFAMVAAWAVPDVESWE